MTRAAAIWTLACLSWAGQLGAQPQRPGEPGPPDLLDQAASALDAGEFAMAEAASRAALTRSLSRETRDLAERAEAWRILGLSLYHLDRKPEAEQAFLEYLKLVPKGKLDSQLHPIELVAFLNQVAIKYDKVIAGHQPKKEKRRFAVNLVPPFGQFQNEEPVKGIIVGGLEVALIATNVTTYFVLRSWCDADATCLGGEFKPKKVVVLQVVNVAAGLAFGGVYLFGVIDGWRGYRQWKRRQSSLFEMSFHVMPTIDGGALATVGGSF